MLSRFAITFGKINSTECPMMLFVSTSTEVKQLAKKFITVIPDDVEDYAIDIDNWNGDSVLTIIHQDDDTFLFQVAPIKSTVNLSDFNEFILDNAV